MFKSYELLEWSDLFNVDHPKYKNLTNLYDYDVMHNQKTNLLIRIPYIIKLFDYVQCVYVSTAFEFIKINARGLNTAEYKEVLSLLHTNVARMQYFAINVRHKEIIITPKPEFIDEPFEVYRNRLLFELRDIIGISHQGYGKDSIMLPSKYTGGKFKLTMG